MGGWTAVLGPPSDPDDSSSSPSSNDGKSNSHYRRNLDKKKKKQEKREQLLCQSRFQSVNPPEITRRTIVVEKPKYKDPESFDGMKSKFKGWYRAVTEWISTLEESFSMEKQKLL